MLRQRPQSAAGARSSRSAGSLWGEGAPLRTQHRAGLRELREGTLGLWPGVPARLPWPTDSATRPVSGPPGATCGFLSGNVQNVSLFIV